nr:PREDICTED: uncharacterized protein LOC109040934 [Bemisia tabaci]
MMVTKNHVDSGGFDVRITSKYPSVRGNSAKKARKSRSVGPASSHGRKNAARPVRKIQSADRATSRGFQKANKVHVAGGSPEKVRGKIEFGKTRVSRLNGSSNSANEFKGRRGSGKFSRSDEDSQEGSSSGSSTKAPARRMCSKWSQFKLPKYNGLNSEYGLSADQLYERKIQKAERAKLQRDLNQQLNAEKEEKQRINEQMFRAWLAKKREQSKQKYMTFSKFNYAIYYSKFSPLNRRSSPAQLEENRRTQNGHGKVSQTKCTEEEGSNFEIYLGLSVD